VDAVFLQEKYRIFYSAINCDLKGCIMEENRKNNMTESYPKVKLLNL